MKAVGIIALVLTALLFHALRPEAQAAMPSWAPLAVLVIIGGILLWLRHKLGLTSSGSMAGTGGGNDVSLGCHEYAHGLAIKKGGGELKHMEVGKNGGHTDYDLGRMTEESPEHLRAIAAGREAQVVYLMRRRGWTRRQAESAFQAHGDDAAMHQYASRRDVATARKEAKRFVRWHYNEIEAGGRKLARKGRMTSL